MRLEMPRFACCEMAEIVEVTVSMAETGLRVEAVNTRGLEAVKGRGGD